jgi:hypothetical protein
MRYITHIFLIVFVLKTNAQIFRGTVEYEKKQLIFQCQKSIKNWKKKIQKPSKGIEITKQEYDAILSEMANNKYKK